MNPESARFETLLGAMTRAICAGDGAGAAACFTPEGGLIRRYGEEFDRAPVLARLGFSDERILKSVRRWAAE